MPDCVSLQQRNHQVTHHYHQEIHHHHHHNVYIPPGDPPPPPPPPDDDECAVAVCPIVYPTTTTGKAKAKAARAKAKVAKEATAKAAKAKAAKAAKATEAKLMAKLERKLEKKLEAKAAKAKAKEAKLEAKAAKAKAKAKAKEAAKAKSVSFRCFQHLTKAAARFDFRLRRLETGCRPLPMSLRGVLEDPKGHTLARADVESHGVPRCSIVFCSTCGAYAKRRPLRLMESCPRVAEAGSGATSLAKIRAGIPPWLAVASSSGLTLSVPGQLSSGTVYSPCDG